MVEHRDEMQAEAGVEELKIDNGLDEHASGQSSVSPQR
jgi:hypothetical protein